MTNGNNDSIVYVAHFILCTPLIFMLFGLPSMLKPHERQCLGNLLFQILLQIVAQLISESKLYCLCFATQNVVLGSAASATPLDLEGISGPTPDLFI